MSNIFNLKDYGMKIEGHKQDNTIELFLSNKSKDEHSKIFKDILEALEKIKKLNVESNDKYIRIGDEFFITEKIPVENKFLFFTWKTYKFINLFFLSQDEIDDCNKNDSVICKITM